MRELILALALVGALTAGFLIFEDVDFRALETVEVGHN
jgi:hypothetical protein